jgi:aspartyl-tRNA(Asn)/glutamyl-tRNA(Gln) amidotransferase subunit A
MTATGLAFATISEVAAALRKRQVSPVELTRDSLARIEAVDATVHSFITVTADLALEQAKRAEQELAAGRDLGPLHGIPVAVKDLYATKGIRTTAHSKVLLDWIPAADARAIVQLRNAGSVLLGKLAMSEFASGTPDYEATFPAPRNPWDLERRTGGSSTGSGAALAAGLCHGALGSDTGGSIRSPAALCGIVGLKPTYGRVSRAGVVPLSWSLDHAGPMARTVADCALLLQAIAGHDPADPASANVAVPDFSAELDRGVKGLRVGVPRAWCEEGTGTSPEVMAAFDAALTVLESLGAKVVDLDAAPFLAGRAANRVILISEAYAYHEETLHNRPQDMGKEARNSFREGAFVTAAGYLHAQQARGLIAYQLGKVLMDVDVIASPASPQVAERFDEFNPEDRYRLPSFTEVYNLTGQPALSLPCGFSPSGLPIGLQIAGRPFDEGTVFRVAAAYEAATDWHQRHPDL